MINTSTSLEMSCHKLMLMRNLEHLQEWQLVVEAVEVVVEKKKMNKLTNLRRMLQT